MTRGGELVSNALAIGGALLAAGSCLVLLRLPEGWASHATDLVCPVLALSMLATAFVAGMHLRARRWGSLLGAAASIAFSAACSVVVLLIGGIDAMFADEDHFADDLTIPAELAVRDPAPAFAIGHIEDEAGARLVSIAAMEPTPDPTATVDIALPSLDAIDASQLDAFRLWLAASPLWHVGEEDGRRVAYRRFAPDPPEGLHDSLHGFYSAPGSSRRGWRVALGLGGPAYTTGDGDRVTRTGARSGAVDVRLGSSGDSFADQTSVLVLDGRPLVVEIFERGLDADRPLTRASLALVEQTLAAYLRGEPLSPPMHGDATLDLTNGMQGGMYSVTAMVNPGEPGRAWMRAFEVTREVELSPSRMRERTTRELPGSSDPTELFRYEADLTVYEGNWGQHYAARFELWFEPADGGPERLLLSDVFRIEGWMR